MEDIKVRPAENNEHCDTCREKRHAAVICTLGLVEVNLCNVCAGKLIDKLEDNI
jgi:hypothetical protein